MELLYDNKNIEHTSVTKAVEHVPTAKNPSFSKHPPSTALKEHLPPTNNKEHHSYSSQMEHSSILENTDNPTAATMEHLSKEKHTDYPTTTRYSAMVPSPYKADINDFDLETILEIYSRRNLRPSDSYGKK